MSHVDEVLEVGHVRVSETKRHEKARVIGCEESICCNGSASQSKENYCTMRRVIVNDFA